MAKTGSSTGVDMEKMQDDDFQNMIQQAGEIVRELGLGDDDVLAAITSQKYQQMQRATELFLAREVADGETPQARLMAASVSGEPAIIEHIIELD